MAPRARNLKLVPKDDARVETQSNASVLLTPLLKQPKPNSYLESQIYKSTSFLDAARARELAGDLVKMSVRGRFSIKNKLGFAFKGKESFEAWARFKGRESMQIEIDLFPIDGHTIPGTWVRSEWPPLVGPFKPLPGAPQEMDETPPGEDSK